MTHLFKVNRICIRAKATINLRKIVNSLATLIFLPEDAVNDTKLLQSDGPQQEF